MLLSRGKVAYNGSVTRLKEYFAGLGYDVLPHALIRFIVELTDISSRCT
jgi:hypothetical protein